MAAPAPKACLITNETTPPEAISDIPLLGPEIGQEETDWIQGAFCLTKPLSEVPRNLITLRLDWQASLRAKRWTIVPSKEYMTLILGELIKAKQESSGRSSRVKVHFELEEECPLYEFVFVPFTMDAAIARVSRGGTVVYAPPYAAYPTIMSKVSPFFAILHAHRAFSGNLGTLTDPQKELYCQLFTMVAIMKELFVLEGAKNSDGDEGEGSRKVKQEKESEGVDGGRPAKRQRQAPR